MLDKSDVRDHLVAAVAALAEADAVARALWAADKTPGASRDNNEAELPSWWEWRFSGLSGGRERLARVTVDGGWDSRFLSVDVIREVSVVRRSLVRMANIGYVDAAQHVAVAICEIDAALAVLGLAALSLREAAYLQPMYEAAYPRAAEAVA